VRSSLTQISLKKDYFSFSFFEGSDKIKIVFFLYPKVTFSKTMNRFKNCRSFLVWFIFLVLIIEIVFWEVSAPSAQAAETGLVGHWKMDEISFPDADNLIDPSTWTVGSGSVTGFTRNGADEENYRISATNPFGGEEIIWEARPGATSDADGGWNGTSFSIDNTKKYRFSVWVQRPVQGNGHFYLGTHGYGSVNGVLQRNNGASTTNPYFTINSNWNEWGDNSSWYLAVGHVWPAGSGTGSNDSDSGIYSTSGTLIYNADAMDYVWLPETTSAHHRTYLYYSTVTATRQRWVYPRVDVVDGTEPSIQELVKGAPTGLVSDASGNNNNGTVFNNVPLATGKAGQALDFNGVDDYIQTSIGDGVNNLFADSNSSWSWGAWFQGEHGTIGGLGGGIGTSTTNSIYMENGDLKVLLRGRTAGDTTIKSGVNSSIWNFVFIVWNGSEGYGYFNDDTPVLLNIGTAAVQDYDFTIATLADGAMTNFEFFDGSIDEVRIYNRALSSTEVKALYTNTPVNIWTNDAVNPNDVTSSSPTLSAEYDYTLSDTATFYQVQVIAEGGSWDTPYWDSTKSACSVAEGERLEIIYEGSALDLNQVKYYQRWKFWDSLGLEGAWSDGTDYFITAVPKNEFGANVRGYAWSDNIGWLSFNNSDVSQLTASYNSGTGELEGWGWSDNIGWISLNCATDDSCDSGTADHQVSIDGEGNLSGEAWSDNLGWLSFDRADTGNPPGEPYSTTGAIARYDSGTKEFSGWAKFLVAPEGGWDGWIKLRCYDTECSAEGWTEGTGAMSGVFVNDDGNIQGWAWGSDVVGWIGFQGPGAYDYGVAINEESNKLSGHVWADNLGWISFDRDETGTPPSDDPCVDESCIARLKTDNYQVDGWARALNYSDGWDGWISLNKKTGDSYDYGVTLNVDSKEFEGWAYGSDVLGWISFNHLTDGSGIDYMVYTGLPMGIQPTDPHDTWDLCSDSLHPTLNWSVSGDINGYQVEIYDDADLSNLVYSYQAEVSSTSHHASYDADNFNDSLGTCHVGENGFQDTSNCNLQYGGTDYWWRVRVRNLDNVWGNWSETDTFKVISNHHWPVPSFSVNPEEPSTDSTATFFDESSIYGGATAASWQWLFSGTEGIDYTYVNQTDSNSQNPEVSFSSTESETVSLKTTDSDGYGPCSCSGGVDITSGSIQWHEVSPSSDSAN
jgi:hypothetical protein